MEQSYVVWFAADSRRCCAVVFEFVGFYYSFAFTVYVPALKSNHSASKTALRANDCIGHAEACSMRPSRYAATVSHAISLLHLPGGRLRFLSGMPKCTNIECCGPFGVGVGGVGELRDRNACQKPAATLGCVSNLAARYADLPSSYDLPIRSKSTAIPYPDHLFNHPFIQFYLSLCHSHSLSLYIHSHLLWLLRGDGGAWSRFL